MFALWSARAPEKNSTEYLRLTNLGVTFDVGDGRSAKAQAGYQIAGLAVALAIAVLGGIVTGNSVLLFFYSLHRKGDELTKTQLNCNKTEKSCIIVVT